MQRFFSAKCTETRLESKELLNNIEEDDDNNIKVYIGNENNIDEDVIKYFINNGFIKIDENIKTVKFNVRDTNNLIKFLNIKA